ncbi:glycine zipper domain-containing protein [Pseudomonas chlororaphis]|uniref:virion core protein, T7 gp14 family n=1 Tax=Pseudomonas chlororaphis TaxID=587753 RepID=UPI0030CBA1DB
MSGALSGAMAGAQTGGSVGGPWGAVIGAVIGLFVGSKVDKENRKRIEEDYKAQVSAMVQTYNYANQTTDLEVQQASEQASSDLANTQTNSIMNIASMRAAASESGMEGNSLDRVMRIAKGSDLRAEDSIKENFSRTVAQSLLIKQTNRIGTQHNLNELHRQVVNSQPSKWTQLLSLGQQAAGSSGSMGGSKGGSQTGANTGQSGNVSGK